MDTTAPDSCNSKTGTMTRREWYEIEREGWNFFESRTSDIWRDQEGDEPRNEAVDMGSCEEDMLQNT